MKKFNATIYFEKWLKANSRRFKNRVKIIERKKDYLVFKYDNIIPEIQLVVFSSGSLDIRVEYHNDCWDGIIDFDISVSKSDNKKYFCEMCEDKNRKYYPSPGKLLKEHVYEEFLKWSNKTISESKFLILNSIKGGRWANIDTRKSLSKYIGKEELHAIFSLNEDRILF